MLIGSDVYGGTYRLFKSEWERFGLTSPIVDMADLAAVEAALQPDTRLIWLETPTNPLLGLADIPAVVELAHRPRHPGVRRQHLRHALCATPAGRSAPTSWFTPRPST